MYPGDSASFGIELVYNYAAEKLDDSLRAQVKCPYSTRKEIKKLIMYMCILMYLISRLIS